MRFTCVRARSRAAHRPGRNVGTGIPLAHAVGRETTERDAPLTDSACVYRGVGCDLTLHVLDNGIAKVTSPHDNPVAHGNLRIKGRFGYQHVRNRD